MDANEPRVRRRGFFLHSDTTGESDAGELENPEGFIVRFRTQRSSSPRPVAPRSVASETPTRGRARAADGSASADEGDPEIRSGSVTGSRQRSHTLR
jgi:hypothetical protein